MGTTAYLADLEARREDRGIFTAKGEPPENRLVVAALLFFTYESLAMHLQDAEDYLTPLIEMGRFTRQGDRLMLPYALTVNHAADRIACSLQYYFWRRNMDAVPTDESCSEFRVESIFCDMTAPEMQRKNGSCADNSNE